MKKGFVYKENKIITAYKEIWSYQNMNYVHSNVKNSFTSRKWFKDKYSKTQPLKCQQEIVARIQY
jgi:hypothetical protein